MAMVTRYAPGVRASKEKAPVASVRVVRLAPLGKVSFTSTWARPSSPSPATPSALTSTKAQPCTLPALAAVVVGPGVGTTAVGVATTGVCVGADCTAGASVGATANV